VFGNYECSRTLCALGLISVYDVDDKYVVFETDCRNPLEQQALLDGDMKVMPLCAGIKKLLAEDS